MHKSCLTLQNYIVKTMNFSINDEFNMEQEQEINIQPKFSRTVNKIDSNSAEVILGFEVEKDVNIPFSMKIDVCGYFHLNDWENPDNSVLMVENTIAILFPYLRALISILTANANIPPYLIPVMNITALFSKKDENQ